MGSGEAGDLFGVDDDMAAHDLFKVAGILQLQGAKDFLVLQAGKLQLLALLVIATVRRPQPGALQDC
jgi:hypothetical protein